MGEQNMITVSKQAVQIGEMGLYLQYLYAKSLFVTTALASLMTGPRLAPLSIGLVTRLRIDYKERSLHILHNYLQWSTFLYS